MVDWGCLDLTSPSRCGILAAFDCSLSSSMHLASWQDKRIDDKNLQRSQLKSVQCVHGASCMRYALEWFHQPWARLQRLLLTECNKLLPDAALG